MFTLKCSVLELVLVDTIAPVLNLSLYKNENKRNQESSWSRSLTKNDYV